MDQSKALPVYGGPVGLKAAGYDPLPVPGYGMFVMVGTPNTGFAYVPEDDTDLLSAYRSSDQELGNPEADALLAEIERRGLND